MNYTTLVHERSGTHSRECEEKSTPEMIKNVIADRIQNESLDHPDGITDEDGKVHRWTDHLRDQEAEVIGEGEHECTSYQHAGETLFAEDVGQHMAVLPEVDITLCEVTIEDIQVGEPEFPLTIEQEEPRQLIWEKRHLLMGKGNALPPAARGVICDIDVGGATPIVQRVRPVGPRSVRSWRT